MSLDGYRVVSGMSVLYTIGLGNVRYDFVLSRNARTCCSDIMIYNDIIIRST